MAAETTTQMVVDSEPTIETSAAVASANGDTAMEVDKTRPERGMKRSAEDETSPESHKKARIGEHLVISSNNHP